MRLLLLFVFFFSTAQIVLDPNRSGHWETSGGAAPTYLRSWDFEETGIPANVSTGEWSGSGTRNWDTTAALSGSESFSIRSISNGSLWNDFASPSEHDTMFMYYEARFVTGASAAGNITLGGIYDGSNVMTSLNLRDSGSGGFRLYHGSMNTNITFTITTTATYYIWLEYYMGTGANGISRCYIDTTGNKPETATAEIINGNRTTQADAAYLSCSRSALVIYDDVYISNEDITSVP